MARLATHPVDAAVVDRLRAAGFTGPEFDQFAERVIAHAQPLVRTWITTGDIFRKATRAGRTMLRMPEHLTADEAEDLARDTVFTVWTTLVTDLEQHRWTPDAALNDHYLDLCVRAFPPRSTTPTSRTGAHRRRADAHPGEDVTEAGWTRVAQQHRYPGISPDRGVEEGGGSARIGRLRDVYGCCETSSN
ncbi:hypothetical protein ACFQ05_26630 [Amycolatopsis umgeniensis]|uniref:Uncharacterized protein n=1 Tax=Amycolatopsis umgeniensis TaxID=336628 RepID=A0A841BBX2_9PSEU|nr:hypothetical protein [Amycolatopsis umgeniensis]MBB5856460.1 hypothetical protein [Amycolatopsis umgeniensis]